MVTSFTLLPNLKKQVQVQHILSNNYWYMGYNSNICTLINKSSQRKRREKNININLGIIENVLRSDVKLRERSVNNPSI